MKKVTLTKALFFLYYFTGTALYSNISIKVTPFIRFKNPVSDLKISSNSKFLAYFELLPTKEKVLKALEIETRNIYTITDKLHNPTFAWAPQGFRLFFRVHTKLTNNKIKSQLFAYDTKLHKNVLVTDIDSPTGYITISPQDLMIRIPSKEKIYTFQLHYPGSRLAKWQRLTLKYGRKKWIVGENGIYISDIISKKLTRLHDDGNNIESFSITKDGQNITWSTIGGNSYYSVQGSPSVSLGFGRQPMWHSNNEMIILSATRKYGRVSTGRDLKIIDIYNEESWLTNSHDKNEVWPVWISDKTALFTVENSSDVFILELKHDAISQPFSAFNK